MSATEPPNAVKDLFDRTAHLRVEIPDDFDPVAIIREGRDAGFEVDRDRHSH